MVLYGNGNPVAELAECILGRGPVNIFAGSGISTRAGAPGPGKIIEATIKRLARSEPISRYERILAKPLLDSFNSSKSKPGVHYWLEFFLFICHSTRTYFQYSLAEELIEKVYNLSEPDQPHYFIAEGYRRGYFKKIITTNFDTLIESAAASLGIRIRNADITKLHGTADKPQKAVMLISQVLKELDKETENELINDLREAPTIFIGYGGNDRDINRVLASPDEYRKRFYWGLRTSDEPLTSYQRIILDINKDPCVYDGDLYDFIPNLACELGFPLPAGISQNKEENERILASRVDNAFNVFGQRGEVFIYLMDKLLNNYNFHNEIKELYRKIIKRVSLDPGICAELLRDFAQAQRNTRDYGSAKTAYDLLIKRITDRTGTYRASSKVRETKYWQYCRERVSLRKKVSFFNKPYNILIRKVFRFIPPLNKEYFINYGLFFAEGFRCYLNVLEYYASDRKFLTGYLITLATFLEFVYDCCVVLGDIPLGGPRTTKKIHDFLGRLIALYKSGLLEYSQADVRHGHAEARLKTGLIEAELFKYKLLRKCNKLEGEALPEFSEYINDVLTLWRMYSNRNGLIRASLIFAKYFELVGCVGIAAQLAFIARRASYEAKDHFSFLNAILRLARLRFKIRPLKNPVQVAHGDLWIATADVSCEIAALKF